MNSTTSLTAKISAGFVSAAVSLTAAIGLYAATSQAAEYAPSTHVVAGTTWDTPADKDGTTWDSASTSDDDGTTWDSAKLLAEGEIPADDNGTTWD
ncbi:hypothetical protein [Sphaerisporangium sp. TRM90804]|uniref:hypothetical protein n=1 Tax=Sphaerisporangium sp. TRM90804 TaxID=3031113 RepID=UPI00244841A3|nr:hypothetical protein [Sphaerisporangium sp. TRM90804]MDH2427466.1 hypothetical protein [Sphaerisporangium sp. TRM90804]MDH2429051.1 hypothetical protein [Sphaerisporangium sp. TRM90804]MDH2430034.1 hypothetical protein [Sphaerisporangium sp. TRM90804]MDH2430416.1 hypothetical protein [Sphaerisporangium sp. TRM90804]